MWSKLIFREIDMLFNIPQNSFRSLKNKRTAKNVVYHTDSNSCKLDIYSKRSLKHTKAPVFINIHGGGFVAGDKYFRRGFCSYIASLGLKVINVNYGLCPEHKYPTFIDHIARAIKWCEDHSDEYFLDMDNVIISGDSAGAYMASALCICSENPDYSNMLEITSFKTKFKGAALFCGPYIPSEAFGKKTIFNLNKLLWRDLTGENVEQLEDLKSYKHYNHMDAIKFADSNFPPTFLSHSDKDVFCIGHAPKLIKILKDNSVPVWEVHSLDDWHDWHTMMNIRSSKTTLHEFERFLAVLLKGDLSTAQDMSIHIQHGRIIVMPPEEITDMEISKEIDTDMYSI